MPIEPLLDLDAKPLRQNGAKLTPGALSFPTKAELLGVIARQKKILETPDLNLDPPWLQNPNDPVRDELRKVSRARTRMTNRLDKAVRTFEQDFDLNS